MYVSVYKELKDKISSIMNLNIRFSYLRKLYVFNIKVIERFSLEKEFLVKLIKQNELFVEVLKELSTFESKDFG